MPYRESAAVALVVLVTFGETVSSTTVGKAPTFTYVATAAVTASPAANVPVVVEPESLKLIATWPVAGVTPAERNLFKPVVPPALDSNTPTRHAWPASVPLLVVTVTASSITRSLGLAKQHSGR